MNITRSPLLVTDYGRLRVLAALTRPLLVTLATLAALALPVASAEAVPQTGTVNYEDIDRAEIERQLATGKAQEYASEQWPDEFAGAWIKERRSTAEVNVIFAFTASPDQHVSELNKLYPTIDARSSSAKYTVVELEDTQAELLSEDVDLGIDDQQAFVDAEANEIVARSAETVSDEKRAAIEDRFDDRVRISTEKVKATEDYACVSAHHCTPTLRGGLALNLNVGTQPVCSSGFHVIHRVSGIWRNGLLTAGHCGSGPFFHGGLSYPATNHKIGRLQKVKDFGPYDYGVVDFSDGTVFGATPKVFLNASIPGYEIYGPTYKANIVQGQTLCKAGQETGWTCGYVVSTNASTGDGHYQMIAVTNYSDFGDSGGALVTPYIGTAVGLLKGGGDYSYYTAIDGPLLSTEIRLVRAS